MITLDLEPLTMIPVCGNALIADISGALYWESQRLLVVSDLHLGKGSSFAASGVFLPPYDTGDTLRRLEAVIKRYEPRFVMALGDSFHDLEAWQRLSEQDRKDILSLQRARDWLWISGNHDPIPPAALGRSGSDHMIIGSLSFRHEPIGAVGEIAGHLHPKARVSIRGRSIERRCFVSDGQRLVMPAFGAYTGGLNIRDIAFSKTLSTLNMVAYVIGDTQVYTIPKERCR